MPHLSTLMLTINLVNMCFFYLTNYVLEMRITWGGGGVGGVREGLLSRSQDLFCFINEFI